MDFFKKLFNDNSITPQEARKRMEQADNHVLLDVRTPPEYKQIRIKGAKLIPVDELRGRAAAELPNKDAPVLVYCQSGVRSKNAVAVLNSMGYKNAVSFGGIINWPYETEKG